MDYICAASGLVFYSALVSIAVVRKKARITVWATTTELNIPGESAQSILTGALCPRKC